MFFPGMKVYLSSSTLKGKIGPRAGSIGYVIDAYRPSLIREGVEAGVCFKMNVLFIRFGNEKRLRTEKKFVVNYIPSKTADVGTKFINEEKTVMRVTSIASGHPNLKIPLVCAVPIISGPSSEKDRIASIFRSLSFTSFLQDIVITNHGNEKIDDLFGINELAQKMLNCVGNTAARLEFVEEILQDGSVLSSAFNRLLSLHRSGIFKSTHKELIKNESFMKYFLYTSCMGIRKDIVKELLDMRVVKGNSKSFELIRESLRFHERNLNNIKSSALFTGF